jgi:hypothetical protein
MPKTPLQEELLAFSGNFRLPAEFNDFIYNFTAKDSVADR